jgi:nucleotide-binding universal stress UspA family protein
VDISAGRRWLDAAAMRLRRPGRTVRTHRRTGHPGEVISAYAAELGAELVILGARGHGPIDRALLGSVSSYVVDHAPCAVLVARRPAVRRIVLGTDGSRDAAAGVAFVAESRLFRQATVRVIESIDAETTWWLGFPPIDGVLASDAYGRVAIDEEAHARATTAAAAARLRAAGLAASAGVRVGSPALALVDEASAWGADLVVVGTRGHAGLKRLLLGSTARSVLQHATASVLIVRGPSGAPRQLVVSASVADEVPAGIASA